MAFQLPELPYSRDALAPHISAETIDFHYGKHHQAYVDNLNRLTGGTNWQSKTLEDIVRTADGAIFNNGAQVWNHTFYWRCMSPHGGGAPGGDLAAAIGRAFGSFDAFKEEFSRAAVGQFGSGWAWLIRDPAGTLAIATTANAGNPLRDGATPLLTCDVWEHAYYIDYRNARPRYVESFWNLISWESVAARLAG